MEKKKKTFQVISDFHSIHTTLRPIVVHANVYCMYTWKKLCKERTGVISVELASLHDELLNELTKFELLKCM